MHHALIVERLMFWVWKGHATKQYITYKSVIYDRERFKWRDNYDTLQDRQPCVLSAREMVASWRQFKKIWRLNFWLRSDIVSGQTKHINLKGKRGILARHLIDNSESPHST
jgi:hypothetical protein